MKISTTEIQRIAALAQLDLTQAEAVRLQVETGSILEYFELLRELKPGTEATLQPQNQASAPEGGPLRADRPSGSLPVGTVLSGAPASEAGHFKVPPVI